MENRHQEVVVGRRLEAGLREARLGLSLELPPFPVLKRMKGFGSQLVTVDALAVRHGWLWQVRQRLNAPPQ